MSEKFRGRLLGINGQMFSGKSTAAQILIDDGWQIVKFAGPLKKITGDIMICAGQHTSAEILSATEGALKNEWLPSLGMTPRKLMQQIGSAYRTVVGDMALWCNIGLNDANKRRAAGIDVAIDDTRFPDPEIRSIHAADGIVWGIRRHGAAAPPVSEEDKAVAEAGLSRQMTEEYAENMHNAFHSAFYATMRDLWPASHPVSFEDALEKFSTVFVDEHIIPLMTPEPVKVDLMNHVSEVLPPDDVLDVLIQNDGTLAEYQGKIRSALQDLNERQPRPPISRPAPATPSSGYGI